MLVQPSMVPTALQRTLKPYFPLLVIVQHLERLAQSPCEQTNSAITALLTVLCTMAINNTDVVSAMCSLQTIPLVARCTSEAYSTDTRNQAIVLCLSTSPASHLTHHSSSVPWRGGSDGRGRYGEQQCTACLCPRTMLRSTS